MPKTRTALPLGTASHSRGVCGIAELRPILLPAIGRPWATFRACADIKENVSCGATMRKNQSSVIVVSIFLAMALVAHAQDEPPEGVQITKGPRVESVTNDTAVIA